MNKKENFKIKVEKIDDYKIKLDKYTEIIRRTSLFVQEFKKKDVYGSKELNNCLSQLEKLMEIIMKVKILFTNSKKINNEIKETMGEIKEQLFLIIKSFGTEKMSDLIYICFDNKYYSRIKNKNKLDIIESYVHPIGFKTMNWKKKDNSKKDPIIKNRIVEDFMIVDRSETLDCFDLARTSQNFQTKVYGVKIAFQNEKEKKTIIVCGLVDQVINQCIDNKYINNIYKNLYLKRPKEPDFERNEFNNFINILSLKDYLIYNENELFNKYMGYINQLDLIKKKTISQVVKEYLSATLYQQRTSLIQLLINDNNSEFQYLAYLLYDLLSNDNDGNIDSHEQTLLFDSLPWYSKKYFSMAMTKTINYTKSLIHFDSTKIPLEQQICLLKANENVKEKAMIKLKEIKAKSEDSGSKARQYLDGLLKIPFSIYKKENILNILSEMSQDINKIISQIDNIKIEVKDKYSIIELKKNIIYLKEKHIHKLKIEIIEKLKKIYTTGRRDFLVSNIHLMNSMKKKYKLPIDKLTHSGKKNGEMKDLIKNFLDNINDETLDELIKKNTRLKNICKIKLDLKKIEKKMNKVATGIKKTKDILDNSVYGHENAKRQVERIIGQWISGKQTGYCFGFEGPPGIGKTSLAKHGISKCLEDDDGDPRPFAFIALGGSSNGSTMSGHNYTYVGSTWGKIVEILMEKKCMNPIIFIDELDKVSKTEHGREIIGILTHLIDTTQNDKFEDKYFSGVGLDLSKVLFIFSYNDAAAIDRILLDRIHRIKFDSLSLHEKIVIAKKYLLPEIYENMCLENIVNITEEILKYIILNYTKEAGVRKLKQILFEIISEINLELLSGDQPEFNITLTIDLIDKKYLKDRIKLSYNVIHNEKEVGIINGLWANAIGLGGIIQIESKFFPSGTLLDLKLTGMQGDVMKESMNVAKTLAWNLCDKETQKAWIEKFEKTKLQGIHVHCPEGAVPKDGPSAGTAITIAIYSLLTGKKIPNTIAITGEMNLCGNVTQIGGLELKILGGIRAGIKKFLFPKENKFDFKKIKEKEEYKDILSNIEFVMIENINEVIKELFN